MTHLKPADPQLMLKLIEGFEDTITPLYRERDKFYSDQVCISCGGSSLQKFGDARTLFRGNDPVPRYNLRCTDCDCTFDPHSGILLSMGNRAKAYEPTVPILPESED